jgi:predicted ester cyclase
MNKRHPHRCGSFLSVHQEDPGGDLMINEQKVREDSLRAFDIFNTKDMSVIGSLYDEILAPDCVYHNYGMPDVVGRENIKQFVSDLYKAMPDLYHNAPEDIIVQGNKVAVRHTVSFTDQDSGKRQRCMIVYIDHYSGDKVIEMWELVGAPVDEE